MAILYLIYTVVSWHNWTIEKEELSGVYENGEGGPSHCVSTMLFIVQLNTTEDYGTACTCGLCREVEEVLHL